MLSSKVWMKRLDGQHISASQYNIYVLVIFLIKLIFIFPLFFGYGNV